MSGFPQSMSAPSIARPTHVETGPKPNLPVPSASTSTAQEQQKKRSGEPPVGSCPGDGHCNGQGGKNCCTGCPAYINKHHTSKSRGQAKGEAGGKGKGTSQAPIPAWANVPDADDGEVSAMVCTNCQTKTTPLWRRDSSGNTCCNVGSSPAVDVKMYADLIYVL